MKIRPDGAFYLEEGEPIPYICPQCHHPIDYDEKLIMVQCTQCTYLGFKEEFVSMNIKPVE